jgi:hypothetical protein
MYGTAYPNSCGRVTARENEYSKVIATHYLEGSGAINALFRFFPAPYSSRARVLHPEPLVQALQA